MKPEDTFPCYWQPNTGLNPEPNVPNPTLKHFHQSRLSLFSDVTPRKLVVRYRRFGITHLSTLQW